jgi:uncharacterized alpha-E superfamily protein
VLARVAHALFATARDLERVDGIARLLETAHARALEGAVSGWSAEAHVWEPLVRILGDHDQFMRTHRRADARSVSWTLGFDAEHPGSIAAGLSRVRTTAGSVRDQFPAEAWEALNAAVSVPDRWPPRRVAREGVYPFCREVHQAGNLIAGVMDHAMRRDEGWEFMCLGRFLERAELTSRSVGVNYGTGAEVAPSPLGWSTPVGDPVVDEARLLIDGVGIAPQTMSRLLLLDRASPRSLAFCMARVEESIERLVGAGAIAPDPSALVLARSARAGLAETSGSRWEPDEVEDFAERAVARLGSIAQALTTSCFLAAHDAPIGRHAQASRQAQN